MLDVCQAWASRCLRCARVVALDDGVAGCVACAAAGIGAPLVPVRLGGPELQPPGSFEVGQGALWRWASHLVPVGVPVSLGEGGTPLVGVDLSGIPGRVLVKDERANPTGSFKDRLASVAVSRARHRGSRTVAVASTGNAGTAVAAYAAAAGLNCVLLATRGLPGSVAARVAAVGARVLLFDDFTDRWTAARTGAERLGWTSITNYMTPPVASAPAGVQAYRTIAYEIAESLCWQVPAWVVLPVSRGDGLFGLWAGFVELVELGWTSRVPRMLAVERFPSLTGALDRGLEQPSRMPIEGPVDATSISDPQGTAMAVHALRASRGRAVVVDDEQLHSAWRSLAARGLLLELSSAAVLHGARALAARGDLNDTSTTVLLATAGLYDQHASGSGADVGRHVADPTDPQALLAAARG